MQGLVLLTLFRRLSPENTDFLNIGTNQHVDMNRKPTLSYSSFNFSFHSLDFSSQLEFL